MIFLFISNTMFLLFLCLYVYTLYTLGVLCRFFALFAGLDWVAMWISYAFMSLHIIWDTNNVAINWCRRLSTQQTLVLSMITSSVVTIFYHVHKLVGESFGYDENQVIVICAVVFVIFVTFTVGCTKWWMGVFRRQDRRAEERERRASGASGSDAT